MMSKTQRLYQTDELTVETLNVTITMLRIGKRQLTLSIYRQFDCESIIDEMTGELRGEPLSRINYFWGECASGDHYHILWQRGDKLFRDCVYDLSDYPSGGIYSRSAYGLRKLDAQIQIAQRQLTARIALGVALAIAQVGKWWYRSDTDDVLWFPMSEDDWRTVNFGINTRDQDQHEWTGTSWHLEAEQEAINQQRLELARLRKLLDQFNHDYIRKSYFAGRDRQWRHRQTGELRERQPEDQEAIEAHVRHVCGKASLYHLPHAAQLEVRNQHPDTNYELETDAQYKARIEQRRFEDRKAMHQQAQALAQALGLDADAWHDTKDVAAEILSHEMKIADLKQLRQNLNDKFHASFTVIKNLEHHFIAG